MTSIPKAVLYYSPESVWSAVARLAIEEKGYGDDEIDFRVVDLSKGENYDLTYLRINPQAIVPSLVVPYENSLTEDVESRYKAITDTKTIVEFLDKSRSTTSRTHSTSSAPAPALTPATIAGTTICKAIIELLHSDTANPITLGYVNARDDASLKSLAKEQLVAFQQRQQALSEFLHQAENGSVRVSEKVKKLWVQKLEATSTILAVLADAEKSASELDENGQGRRAAFFKTARQAWEVNLSDVLTQLSKEMIGSYTLGDQFSIADLHLGGWLARVVKLAGGTTGEDGETAVKRLEEYIGGGYRIGRDEKGQSKLGAIWDALRERASWKKVYGAGLV